MCFFVFLQLQNPASNNNGYCVYYRNGTSKFVHRLNMSCQEDMSLTEVSGSNRDIIRIFILYIELGKLYDQEYEYQTRKTSHYSF